VEQVVGSYTVLQQLGAGSFGKVVLAQRAGGELAAIKLLPRGYYVRGWGGLWFGLVGLACPGLGSGPCGAGMLLPFCRLQ